MLATITLATQHGWFGTWLGSTLGMVAADALAIVVGRQLGRRLPERAVKVGAAVLFFVFGAWLGVDATERLAGRDPVALVAAGLDHHTAGWITLGLAVVLLVLAGLRRPSPAHSVPVVIGGRRAKTRTRALFVAATVLGLPGPILVGIDVVQPIALLDNPGVVATGAAFAPSASPWSSPRAAPTANSTGPASTRRPPRPASTRASAIRPPPAPSPRRPGCC